jgi:hypothetical protein
VCTSKSVDDDNNDTDKPVREAQNKGRQKRGGTLENVRSLGEVGVGLQVTQDGGGGDVDRGGGAGVLVGWRRVDVLRVDAQERRGLHEPLVLHQALHNKVKAQRPGRVSRTALDRRVPKQRGSKTVRTRADSSKLRKTMVLPNSLKWRKASFSSA